MSTEIENTKMDGSKVEHYGRLIMRLLRRCKNGATVTDVIRHLRSELGGSDTDHMAKMVEKVMNHGVAIGFLYKRGSQYFAWHTVNSGRQRNGSKHGRPPKKRRRGDEDGEGRTKRSEDEGGSGHKSHRSDEDGDSSRKHHPEKEGDADQRRRGTKKEAASPHHSDESGQPSRRQQRRRRQRPTAQATECFCYAWTPRRRRVHSLSSNSSSSLAD